MGFVNLPIEGDPAARLPEVLDQIQAALAEDHDRKVRRVGNRIEFSTGSFLRRWLFPGRFLISSGVIEAEASTDSLMVDYRLSFFERCIVATTSVIVFVACASRAHFTLRSTIAWMIFLWCLYFGTNMISAVTRFSRFLRQFPRENSE